MSNNAMMQYFEWNLPNDGKLWANLKADAKHLAEVGISSVWIPPAYKADKQENQGYSTYDLFDLGEFDQKGTVRTKYGTRRELEEAIAELHRNKISVYLDAVLNHKAGADYTEKFPTQEVDPEHRDKTVAEPGEIEGWTGFSFPGRKKAYSDFEWHWYHFSGVDYNQANQKKAIYRIVGEGKEWASHVDSEKGNYDYLMFADIDYRHPDVRAEIIRWGKWMTESLKLDGMRMDAIKHINADFIHDFLTAMQAAKKDKFYAVGEYWKKDIDSLIAYLDEVKYDIALFDVCLHFNFFQASQQGRAYDLRNLLSDALVIKRPFNAVTFVDNHDSQRGSSLESQIKDWFKPLAYGLILMLRDGCPCIFYGDYYRMGEQESPHRAIIDICLAARRDFAYGDQTLYFDHGNTVGLVRMGDADHPGSGLAFLMASGDNGCKTMNVGKERKGEIWREYTGNIKTEVTIDENGNGAFSVSGGNIAIWVEK